MVQLSNSYCILYILFAWILGMCYGFVLLSAATGQFSDVSVFESGKSWLYELHSTVLMNENGNNSKNVGFYLSAQVQLESVWKLNNEALLKITINSPDLYIRSRKAPSPDGFIQHTSNLQELSTTPNYAVWKNGRIEQILLPKNEPVSFSNLKKGITSLFQFQVLDVTTNETDSSGSCEVNYASLSPNQFKKIKTNCLSPDLSYIKNPDTILDTVCKSYRATDYELDSNNNYLKSIKHKETHEIFLNSREELGNFIEVDQILTFLQSGKTDVIEAKSLEEALNKISNKNDVYVSQKLITVKDESIKEDRKLPLSSSVNENRKYLKSDLLGTASSAKVFLKVVAIARDATKEDIAKVLGSKKNKEILPQLYDIMGYVQTVESHEAVMKQLHFDREEHIDLSERYLWSLSLSPQPNKEIITNLLKRFQKYTNIPDKIKETLILTIASMTYRLKLLQLKHHVVKVSQNVEEVILNNLEYAKGDEKSTYLRALKNLKSPSTIPVLLTIIKNGSLKEAVLAWKALKSFDPSLWDHKVKKAAYNSFLQLHKKYDSSARTIASDIILESNPSDEDLKELIYFLNTNQTAYDIKQYVFQRIKMFAGRNNTFKNRIASIIKSDKFLNNYSVLAPRGLSTSLEKQFMTNPSSNASLISIQETQGSIVKRGIISVMVDKHQESKEIFTLGLFAAGLNSFVSSGNDEEAEEESATAGMELTVLGTQIRPFVFFDGQGELMGHVWSGTASERTTAYQALVLLQDHLEYLRLGSGFIAEIDFKGAASFDLSGKVELSIWNRNAQASVQKMAGIVLIGVTKIESSFVRSQVEFSSSAEPKLNFEMDIDFSGPAKCCLKLSQPDVLFRHNIFKIERIPGSKHKLRIAKYRKSNIPGITYALNKKNDDNCSSMSKL